MTITLQFTGALDAQIPGTPAGRQLSAWIKAQDTLNRDTIQDFIEKNMPWARVDQELAIRKQSGGFDVKRIEESNDTHLVVLAQQRGPTHLFFRITIVRFRRWA